MVPVLIALLLTVPALAALPRAIAEPYGGYADRLVFSVVPQDQAVAAVSNGDIDMYIFPLDTATDRQAARDDPEIHAAEVAADLHNLLLNPVVTTGGTFNPFSIREIREAMHWAYDREFIVDEFAGGFGIPMTSPYARGEPAYAEEVEFFEGLETQYAYDPAEAKTRVYDAMSMAPGATFDVATNKWLMNGTEIEVRIVLRTLHSGPDIGRYVATEVERLGFTPVMDYAWPGEEIILIYFSDPRHGHWHIYAERWNLGVSYLNSLDDTRAPYFFNGDFGSAIWDYYSPPPRLQIPCERLRDGEFETDEERRGLLRTCVSEGMREGVRSFVLRDTDLYALNRGVTNTVISSHSGLQQPFAFRTTIKEGQAGGTLHLGQPVHTGSTWNLYGGFQDIYSRSQAFSITDFGAFIHPRLNEVIPIRTDFVINNVGPTGAHFVPTSALTFDRATNTFVNVSSGLTSGAYVDFTLKLGEWHHGEMMTMADVLATIAMYLRMGDGDLAVVNPTNANQIYLTRWSASFRGFETLGPDRIRVWFDTYNPDEALIALRADLFPWYPWELNAILAESVLAGESAFSDTDADLLGSVPLDLAKGPTLALLDPRLASHSAATTIPVFLKDWVTPIEASARWAALDEWRHPAVGGCTDGPTVWSCNYYVSQGPYYLDQYLMSPEGAHYLAKRTGYPIAQDAWDSLAGVRVPRVDFSPLPQVIQTFPATFRFTTTLDGEPYGRIRTASWLVTDSITDLVRFSGEAARSGAGHWTIEFSPLQTTNLWSGTFELKVTIVGEEAPFPVTETRTFEVHALSSVIGPEITRNVEESLAEMRAHFAEDLARSQAAIELAHAQTVSLLNAVLIVAISSLGIVAVALGAFLVFWLRRRRDRGV